MVDKARVDTKSIVKTILNLYEDKEYSYYEFTRDLLYKIEEAFGKFIKAHQFLLLVKNNGL